MSWLEKTSPRSYNLTFDSGWKFLVMKRFSSTPLNCHLILPWVAVEQLKILKKIKCLLLPTTDTYPHLLLIQQHFTVTGLQINPEYVQCGSHQPCANGLRREGRTTDPDLVLCPWQTLLKLPSFSVTELDVDSESFWTQRFRCPRFVLLSWSWHVRLNLFPVLC